MSYFTIKNRFFLQFSQKMLEEFKKIDKFMNLLENSGVGSIIESVKFKNEKCKGRLSYNPYNLFAAIIYCFANFNGTLRDIEDKCIFDIRVNYIMEGIIPDHSTIGNFINEYIVPNQYEIFTCINKEIIKELNLDVSDSYIDGSKFEANANKYKFVWKPTKFHIRLDEKIKLLLDNIGYKYSEEVIKAHELNELLNKYTFENNIDINNIPFGRGKRLTKEQKNYKIGYNYLVKLNMKKKKKYVVQTEIPISKLIMMLQPWF